MKKKIPLIVIPAIKKNAVIPDQLVKKLNGKTLIQRAIDTAKEIADRVFVVTDSQEIGLICKRNGVSFYKDAALRIDSNTILETVSEILSKSDFYEIEEVMIYRANTPLVTSSILIDAYHVFSKDPTKILVSLRKLDKQLIRLEDEVLVHLDNQAYFKELKAFLIFHKAHMRRFAPYEIAPEASIEIETYQDWWICEKILQQKTIVFHVIGSTQIGMGHIYRALALAHEITDHKILFVCDERYEIAVEKIASTDYQVIATKDVAEEIVRIAPDIVVNDVLNTDAAFIRRLRKNGMKTVNFEDLGSGALEADLVINELYDTPQIEAKHIVWGHRYVTLRDEFENALQNGFKERVENVLIMFGGTDQNNLTLTALRGIIDIAAKESITIRVVCGGGYLFKTELEAFLQKHPYRKVYVTYAAEAVSELMENVQIAITSNGRTVYELAHMHIPSIVVSHHEREATHTFATLERGFVNLGVYEEKTLQRIHKHFAKLVYDTDYRKLLFLNIAKFDFRYNKKTVIEKILGLLT